MAGAPRSRPDAPAWGREARGLRPSPPRTPSTVTSPLDLPAPTRRKPGRVHQWEVLAAHHTSERICPVPGQQRDPARRKKPCPLPPAHVRTMEVNFPPVRHLTKDKCKVNNQAGDPLALLQAFSGLITGSWPSGHTPTSASRKAGRLSAANQQEWQHGLHSPAELFQPGPVLLPATAEGAGLWAAPEGRDLQVLEKLDGP